MKNQNESRLQTILTERLSTARQIFDSMESENKKMSTFFFQLAILIEETYIPKKPLISSLSFEKMFSDNQPLLCGFPGTLQDSFNILSNTFTELNQYLHTMSTQLKNKCLEFQRFPDNEIKKKVLKILNDSQLPINDLQLLNTIIRNAEQGGKKEYIKTNQKLTETVQSYMKKNEINEKQKKNISELFSQIQEARKTTEPQRLMLIQKANTAITTYKHLMFELSKIYQNRIDFFTETLDISMFGCMKVASMMQNFSGLIKDNLNEINFKNDMSNFIKARKIVRYDMQIPQFKEFICETKAFQSINSRVRFVTQSYDPIGFVQIIHSFRATNPNEISCVKGKRLLLLENPSGDWTFVMHPYSRIVGFVPTQCILKIGIGLAIVLRKPKQDELLNNNILLIPGEYVAVTNFQTLSFETSKGEICNKSPANLIGIVYQSF